MSTVHEVYLTDEGEKYAPPAGPMLRLSYVPAGNDNAAIVFLDFVIYDETYEEAKYSRLELNWPRSESEEGSVQRHASMMIPAEDLLKALASVMGSDMALAPRDLLLG